MWIVTKYRRICIIVPIDPYESMWESMAEKRTMHMIDGERGCQPTEKYR